MFASSLRSPYQVEALPSLSRANSRTRLGQMLLDDGAITPTDLVTALALQKREHAALGEILVAHEMVDPADLLSAVARQHDTFVVDLDASPPDPRLVAMANPKDCLKFNFIPWRKQGNVNLIALTRPDMAKWALMRLGPEFGEARFVLCDPYQLSHYIHRSYGSQLAIDAETRTPAKDSCRNWSTGRFQIVLLLLTLALIMGIVANPGLMGDLFVGLATGVLLVNTLVKGICIFHFLRRERMQRGKAVFLRAEKRKPMRRLPKISVLVPLFKEHDIAGALVARLSRITYPPELLEICLVVEADDAVTRKALNMGQLPRLMRVIRVPEGGVKTKPRAMNYALDFTSGDIIGVYDAEDAPAPDQLYDVARRFSEAPAELACLQGVLSFYNPYRNWLSRCFSFEYAAWFRLMLPGLQRLGFAIPLGGTTLFFRREALVKLGGWDAHNVTEDADLGMRLARRGYRCEIIDTVTEEEANSRLWPWIRQRSRWLKGYAITWCVHMRSPLKLLRELGPRKFLGFQILFLGTLLSFFLAPVLWSVAFASLSGLPTPLSDGLGPFTGWQVTIIFFAAEIVTLLSFVLAARQMKNRPAMLWVLSLPAYFVFGTVAAYKGLFELMVRPFYWDKTQHGEFGGSETEGSADPPSVDLQAGLKGHRQVVAKGI